MFEDLVLLTNRKIIDILDGDSELGSFSPKYKGPKKNFSMPYLSGPVICDIAKSFGTPITYGTGASRWEYFQKLLTSCIRNQNISNLIEYLFAKHQFKSIFSDLQPDDFEIAYKEITDCALQEINEILSPGNNKLVCINNKYFIQKINEYDSITPDIPAIKKVNKDYIKNISERSLKDIANGEFDSAISKSRTLLEEVFCDVIEKKGEIPSNSGNINELYKQVKSLYRMHQDKKVDERINMLLSGLEKILKAISDMRNNASDAHGVGNRRINIKKHHAHLFVNTAMVMADFILDVQENSKTQSILNE